MQSRNQRALELQEQALQQIQAVGQMVFDQWCLDQQH